MEVKNIASAVNIIRPAIRTQFANFKYVPIKFFIKIELADIKIRFYLYDNFSIRWNMEVKNIASAVNKTRY